MLTDLLAVLDPVLSSAASCVALVLMAVQAARGVA